MSKRKFPVPNAVLSEYFKIDNIIDVSPFGHGHINKTYIVVFPTCKYCLQKINDNVFSNPFAVMNNMELVTNHIRKNVIYSGSTLTSILKSSAGLMLISQPILGWK